mmetsp:Transcript_63175/g.105090  ORF Transcript_63175/g.105090 Transcript_63175/m.105090 type:complete len:420 (+) Transcript_63175:75-1334(+)
MRLLQVCFLPGALLLPSYALQIETVDAGRGPVEVQLPDSYDSSQNHALVVLLPGYGDDHPGFADQFGLGSQLNSYDGRFIQLLARGRTDMFGNQYWMAWGNWVGSCNPDASYSYAYWYDSPADEFTADEAWARALQYCGTSDADVLYIRALVAKAVAAYAIDQRKIFALGQSNGAAMVYRLGCDASDLFSAIVAIEGAPPSSEFGCSPSHQIRLLNIHGTKDRQVPYQGKTGSTGFDGAVATCERYIAYNRCSVGTLPAGATRARWAAASERHGISLKMDISKRIDGDDTEVYRAQSDCASGPGAVELWKVVGETHSPNFNANYVTSVLQWLDWPLLPLPFMPPSPPSSSMCIMTCSDVKLLYRSNGCCQNASNSIIYNRTAELGTRLRVCGDVLVIYQANCSCTPKKHLVCAVNLKVT